jgi:hypothetical protein
MDTEQQVSINQRKQLAMYREQTLKFRTLVKYQTLKVTPTISKDNSVEERTRTKKPNVVGT